MPLRQCNQPSPSRTKIDSEELRIALQYMKHMKNLDVPMSRHWQATATPYSVCAAKQYHSLCHLFITI